MFDRPTLNLLVVLALAAASGCDESQPQRTTAEQPTHDEPAAARASAPTPAPLDPPSSPTADPPPVASPREDVRIELGWAFQLATKKRREDAEQLRTQAIAAGLDAIAEPYLLARGEYILLMAGSFTSEAQARDKFDAAKAVLGQGGFIRSMREFCPGQRRDAAHEYACVDVELPPPTDAVAADQSAPTQELHGYPSPTGPDPAARSYPPAQQLLVIASNRTYSPGKPGVDRDAKYRTWIWYPQRGALPDKGKWEAPEGSTAAPLLEVHDSLVVSNGKQLWSVEPGHRDVLLWECTCLYGEGGLPYRHLKKRLVDLRARPLAGGDEITLIDAEDFPHDDASDCIEEREHVDHVLQVQAVAGARLLVVERSEQREPCPEPGEPVEHHAQRVLEIAGTRTLAVLEAELPYDVIKRARLAASAALGKATTADQDALAPAALLLTGVFPRYREHAQGMRLVLQYSVAGNAGVGGWTDGYDSHTVTIEYPASSSLAPPADQRPLIDYVAREYGSWKVIGWSRHG